MAGHEKVYGVCENKCFVETMSKEQVGTKFEEQQNRYSTEEDVPVGKWTDGNVIKRKTIETTAAEFTYANGVYTYNRTIGKIYQLVDCYCIVRPYTLGLDEPEIKINCKVVTEYATPVTVKLRKIKFNSDELNSSSVIVIIIEYVDVLG